MTATKILTKDHYCQIAKIISNDVNGSENTFSVTRKEGYDLLSTNKCDYAPFIRVYTDRITIDRIKVLGDYTDGWDDLQPATIERINKYLVANGFEEHIQ